MGTVAPEAFRPVLPNGKDRVLAREARQALEPLLHGNSMLHLGVEGSGRTQKIPLPRIAFRCVLELLAHLEQGHSVAVLPTQSELTTQQAADLLNVSRPFMVGLLESKKLPFHKVGTHRRVLLKDVIAYKKSIDAKRSVALDELAKQSQELGLDR